MIKFFRTIRKQLMGEGKTGTYLKYAIGEILLVVIGILIALWLNNWNESRKDRIKEAFFLNQIKKELLSQKDEIKKRQSFSKDQQSHLDSLLFKFNEPNFIASSQFNQHLNPLVSAPDFKLINTVFIELKSTGQLELVKSDALRTQLMKTYEELQNIARQIKNNDDNVYYPVVFTPLLDFVDKEYPVDLKPEFQRRFKEKSNLIELWGVLGLAKLTYYAYERALQKGESEIETMLAMLTDVGIE